jgi:hypothetical protein
MTSYAGISILQCSSCTGHISHHLLASGNTFGARYWTDGWRDAPMLPEEPSLVKCPHCRAMVWMSELEEVAEIDKFMDSAKDFPDAAGYLEPAYADYLQYAAENADLSENRQLYIRMHAWWRGNDTRRDIVDPEPLSEGERDNLVKLAALLTDDSDHDRIMRAEIMRQLGEFAAAKVMLSGEFSDEMQRAIEIIGKLTEKQVSPVAEMN